MQLGAILVKHRIFQVVMPEKCGVEPEQLRGTIMWELMRADAGFRPT